MSAKSAVGVAAGQRRQPSCVLTLWNTAAPPKSLVGWQHSCRVQRQYVATLGPVACGSDGGSSSCCMCGLAERQCQCGLGGGRSAATCGGRTPCSWPPLRPTSAGRPPGAAWRFGATACSRSCQAGGSSVASAQCAVALASQLPSCPPSLPRVTPFSLWVLAAGSSAASSARPWR